MFGPLVSLTKICSSLKPNRYVRFTISISMIHSEILIGDRLVLCILTSTFRHWKCLSKKLLSSNQSVQSSRQSSDLQLQSKMSHYCNEHTKRVNFANISRAAFSYESVIGLIISTGTIAQQLQSKFWSEISANMCMLVKPYVTFSGVGQTLCVFCFKTIWLVKLTP